jgi:phosphoglycerate dehydrogenase-like enzyme
MSPPTKPHVLVLAGDALFASFFGPAERRLLSRHFSWRQDSSRRATARFRRSLATADGLITTWDSPTFDEGLLEASSRLRAIAHCGGEVQHRFSRHLFDRLVITNAAGPMARPVAELAATFLLYSARRIDEYRRALARGAIGIYDDLHRHGRAGETLLGAEVGLIGFGRIGRALVDLLDPFGVRWLVHDPYARRATLSRPSSVRFLPFEDVLRRSTWLVVCAALTDETRGLLSAGALAILRPGATVINVARGELIDLDALGRAVRSGRLRCALDVTDPLEPLPRRHPLRRMAGAMMTPHVGAIDRTVRTAMARVAIENLDAHFAGRRVTDRVTTEMLRYMT